MSLLFLYIKSPKVQSSDVLINITFDWNERKAQNDASPYVGFDGQILSSETEPSQFGLQNIGYLGEDKIINNKKYEGFYICETAPPYGERGGHIVAFHLRFYKEPQEFIDIYFDTSIKTQLTIYNFENGSLNEASDSNITFCEPYIFEPGTYHLHAKELDHK